MKLKSNYVSNLLLEAIFLINNKKMFTLKLKFKTKVFGRDFVDTDSIVKTATFPTPDDVKTIIEKLNKELSIKIMKDAGSLADGFNADYVEGILDTQFLGFYFDKSDLPKKLAFLTK